MATRVKQTVKLLLFIRFPSNVCVTEYLPLKVDTGSFNLYVHPAMCQGQPAPGPFNEEEDCMVPSTPTLFVPKRTDGFAEAIR